MGKGKGATMDLAELEEQVGLKWARCAAARLEGQWPAAVATPFDISEWMVDRSDLPELVSEVPQFPREQWASYPNARTAVLVACDKLLDRGDKLSDDDWFTVCLAMTYGGKTRLS